MIIAVEKNVACEMKLILCEPQDFVYLLFNSSLKSVGVDSAQHTIEPNPLESILRNVD